MSQKLQANDHDHSPTSSVQDEQNNAAMASPSGNQQFSLFRALHKGQVIANVQGDTKEKMLHACSETIAKNLGLDGDVLADLLLDRENLTPTALNHGIAVPHARDFLLTSLHDVVTVVFPEKPIPYGAMDGQPVHTLFFLFASQDKRHLHLLAKIAHLSSQPEALEFMKTRPSKEALLAYVKEWESSIPSLAQI